VGQPGAWESGDSGGWLLGFGETINAIRFANRERAFRFPTLPIMVDIRIVSGYAVTQALLSLFSKL